jgi:hypothetical protein
VDELGSSFRLHCCSYPRAHCCTIIAYSAQDTLMHRLKSHKTLKSTADEGVCVGDAEVARELS